MTCFNRSSNSIWALFIELHDDKQNPLHCGKCPARSSCQAFLPPQFGRPSFDSRLIGLQPKRARSFLLIFSTSSIHVCQENASKRTTTYSGVLTIHNYPPTLCYITCSAEKACLSGITIFITLSMGEEYIKHNWKGLVPVATNANVMENHYLQENHRSIRLSRHQKVYFANIMWFGFCL
jgi:hypothetical protein